MGVSNWETKLKAARRRVFEGREVVERQRAWVDRQRLVGGETRTAEAFLATLERVLTTYGDDLRNLKGRKRTSQLVPSVRFLATR